MEPTQELSGILPFYWYGTGLRWGLIFDKMTMILALSGVKMKLSGLVDLVNPTDEEIVIAQNGCPASVFPITENVSI